MPEAALDKLLSEHRDIGRFDVVIADEVQGLLYASYFDVLDLILQGGLVNGSWQMFGDFERQMLYGQDRDQANELLHTRLGTFAKGTLRVNCRNTPHSGAFSISWASLP